MTKMIFSTNSTLVLLILVTLISSSNSIEFQNDNRLISDYYVLIDSVRYFPFDKRIQLFKKFLNNNANFENIYEKILDEYLYAGKLELAKMCFINLLDSSKFRRNCNWMLAKIYSIEGRPDDALNAYKKALKIYPISISILKNLIEFNRQYYKMFDFLEFVKQVSTDNDIMDITHALYYYENYEFEKANFHFSKISDDNISNIEVLYTWGMNLYRLRKYDSADSVWHEGLLLADKLGDLDAKARFQTNKALLKIASRNYDDALFLLKGAENITKYTNNKYQLQLIIGHKAQINIDKGDYRGAISKYKKAIEICAALKQYKFLAEWYHNYAVCMFYLGNFSNAFKAYNISERYAKQTDNIRMIAKIKLNLGTDYIYLKQYSMARRAFIDAYQIAEDKGLDYYKYFAKAKLGEIFLSEQKFSSARKYFEDFVKYLINTGEEKWSYGWIGRIAKTYLLEGRYDMAKLNYMKAYNIALNASDKAYQGWYILFAGDMDLLLGNRAKAVEKFDMAHKIASEQNNTEMLWQVLMSKGNAYEKSGDIFNAISSFKEAIAIIEDTREEININNLRIGYFSEAHKAYKALVHCYFNQFQILRERTLIDSIFHYEQLSRARALQDLVFYGKTKNMSDEFQSIKKDLGILNRALRKKLIYGASDDSIESQLNDINNYRFSLLSHSLQSINKAKNTIKHRKPKTWDLNKIQQLLDEIEHTILIYNISEINSFVIVINADTADIFSLNINRNKLDHDVNSLIYSFHNVVEDSIKFIEFNADMAHHLYKMLFKVIEDKISLTERLIIIPDLSIFNFPFEIMLFRQTKSNRYNPYDNPEYSDYFLVNKYKFTYCPSPFILKSSKKRSDKPNILLVANPVTRNVAYTLINKSMQLRTGWRFDPLPYSEIEVEEIRKYFEEANLFKRYEATQSNFIKNAEKADIIHLATHAYIDTLFDVFSGLVLTLSEDSLDDGLLMGYEIADLNLKCDLVILSACETGIGQKVIGEGVLGLPRICLGSGTNSVLMTLWKVEDKFTSKMLPNFYRYLVEKNLSKTDALTMVKREFLKRTSRHDGLYYQHPFFWSSFMLFGQPGTTKRPQFVEKVLFSFIILAFILLIIIFRKTLISIKSEP